MFEVVLLLEVSTFITEKDRIVWSMYFCCENTFKWCMGGWSCSCLQTTHLHSEVALAGQPALWFCMASPKLQAISTISNHGVDIHCNLHNGRFIPPRLVVTNWAIAEDKMNAQNTHCAETTSLYTPVNFELVINQQLPSWTLHQDLTSRAQWLSWDS